MRSSENLKCCALLSVLRNPWLTWISSIVVGCIFLYASYHKIADPPDFVKSIHNYCLVPRELVNIAAIYMPWFEAIAGLALLVNLGRRGAAAGLGLLSVAFLLALGYNLARGHPTVCGCFGKFADGVAWSEAVKFQKMRSEMLLDVALIGLCAQILIGSARRSRKPEPEV